MSRSQQNQTYDTASNENQTYNTDAQKSFTNAQQGITDYGNQLAKFSAANPYVQGGEYQTTTNQQLAGTAAGTADATKQAVEGAAVRTGSNMGGAVAGAEEAAQQAQRTLGTQEASANQNRIGSEAGYNEKSLAGYQNLQQMQDQIAQQEAAAAQGALGTQESAANTPSFTDMLGAGLINGIGTAGTAAVAKYCWIAAELYGGWGDRRTRLVRAWLQNVFARRFYGPAVLAAYARWGEQTAARLRHHRMLRRAAQWLFDRALKAAETWEANRG